MARYINRMNRSSRMWRRIIGGLVPLSVSCLLCLEGCTYPFDIDYDEETRIVVFNGDIIAGAESIVYGYLSEGFGEKKISMSGDYYGYDTFPMEGYVEGEDGSKVVGEPETDNSLHFDTGSLKTDIRYRVYLKDKSSGNEYRSEWTEVMGAPVIDSLSYYLNYDERTLTTRVSVTAEDTPYISLTSSFSWRVTPWAVSYFDYIVPDRSYPFGQITLGNVYPASCYTINDDHIRTFATVTMKEGKLVNYDLYTFDRSDRKISGTLRLRVKARQISKESYLYWQNLEKTSSMSGDLFTPTPSSMRGNVSNINDADEMVLGYIGISKENSMDLYIKNSEHMFYRQSKDFDDEFARTLSDGTVPEPLWYETYQKGYAPYRDVYSEMGFFIGYTWIDRRCLDCTFAGGSPEKPEDWTE
ncbi:MAG: DUF4249 family protein [Bacteroidales bacterium]|nr:DUF4249 family protein [Bacteroidales bacterium]